MTINKLTDERLKELSAGYSSYIDESQAIAQELQEYRKGLTGMGGKPVLSMQFKNGWPVTGTAGVISGSPRIADGYHDFYFAPQPLTDSERAELQEYRKAAAEPVGEFYHEKAGWYQISEGDRVPDNRRIPLYAAPQPLTDAERLELQEYRKASQALLDVTAERMRQQSAKGYSTQQDDTYIGGELAAAAISYIEPMEAENYWPADWHDDSFKPSDYRRNLVKAGALILAEIERFDRAAVGKGDAS